MFRFVKSWVVIMACIALVALVTFEAAALGARETVVRDVGGFDSVSLGTSGRLIIAQGDREGLRIEARPQQLPRIITEVRGGVLYIDWIHDGPSFSFRPPVFRLTVKTIASLETHSSGSIEVGSLRASSLRIRISSSGGISIGSLAAASLDVQITSSGWVSVGGRADKQNVLLSSSGSYRAGDLASRTARVNVSSSGNATIRVSDSLQASVTSSGNVRYYGNARVDGNVTSSGQLVKAGN